MATDYIPIRWGDRLYLIPEADRGEFCNGVNQGDEAPGKIHRATFI